VRALDFHLARRFLRGRLLGFGLTVVALACGVALVCAIDLVNRAVERAFVEVIDTMAGRAALQVTTEGGGVVPESLAARVAEVDGVELAVPVVSAVAFTTDGSGDVLTVHGVDLGSDAAVRVYEPSGSTQDQDMDLDDPLSFLAQPDSIMLTKEFAARHGLDVDDGIELDTPLGRRRLVVRQLLAPRGVARVQGGNLALMDVQAAEVLFTRPGFVNRLDVVVERGADVERVAAAVARVLPPGVTIEPPAQRKVDLHRVMQSSAAVLRAVSLIGLLAAFLIAFSRLSSVFEAHTWEHAVLRAVGVPVRSVWWELTKEALLVAAPGVALGIPLGIGLAYALLPVVTTTTALSAKLIAPDGQLGLTPSSVLMASGLGFVAVVLAAALPGWRAAQVTVSTTLKRRGTELDTPAAPRTPFVRIVTIVLALAAAGVHVATGSAPIGLVATGFVVVAFASLARPLLDALAEPLRRLGARIRPTGRLAIAGLFRNRRRTSLAVAMLCVGFGAVLWLYVLAISFERSVLALLPGKLRGDLSITSVNMAGYVEAPVHEALLADLAAVPGVALAVGEQAIDWQFAGGPVAVDAFDPAYFTDPRFGGWALVGARLPEVYERVARGEAAIVSENLTRNLGVQVGDRITLDSPAGPIPLDVAGVVSEFLSPRGTINISRELYERQWGDPHVVRGLVKLAPGTDTAEVQARITRTLGDRHHLRILTIDGLMEWFAQQVRRAFGALHVLAGLVLVVVLTGVGDALAAETLERTHELGVARALGIRRRALAMVVLGEAVLLGLLGAVLALVLGLGLGAMWVHATFPALLGWTLQLHFPLLPIVGVSMAVVAVCLLAAYLPALRAAHVDPIVALRAE
jgi:putative ABC transport system permease protein